MRRDCFPLARDERFKLVEALLDDRRLVNCDRTIHGPWKVNAPRIIGQGLSYAAEPSRRPVSEPWLTNHIGRLDWNGFVLVRSVVAADHDVAIRAYRPDPFDQQPVAGARVTGDDEIAYLRRAPGEGQRINQ